MLNLLSTFNKHIPRVPLPFWKSLTSPEEDAFSNPVSSSASTSSESLVYTTPQNSVQGWKKSSQRGMTVSAANDYGGVFSWRERMKRLSSSSSREYNELLVVGIVIFFLAAMTGWKAVGRSDRL